MSATPLDSKGTLATALIALPAARSENLFVNFRLDQKFHLKPSQLAIRT